MCLMSLFIEKEKNMSWYQHDLMKSPSFLIINWKFIENQTLPVVEEYDPVGINQGFI